ncbi:GNAT family N-acetyltransferase [Streptosporangium sp. LJ11]|uniref:GNAT family N-acetyltransferase n=1 Tax=Streptosporangium sp. LJ11 TaxID=3436927 RepID=UPI003F7A920A
MLIRAARADEGAALAALVLRSKAHWGYDEVFMAACREELTVAAARMEARRTVVAERDGRILGMATLEGEPPTGELGMLFVEPEAIGQGVGRRLFAHVTEAAARAGFARLGIDSDPHAEPFYLAMGAVRVGEVPSGSVAGRLLPRLIVDVARGARSR